MSLHKNKVKKKKLVLNVIRRVVSRAGNSFRINYFYIVTRKMMRKALKNGGLKFIY